jgi:hypothetical protein
MAFLIGLTNGNTKVSGGKVDNMGKEPCGMRMERRKWVIGSTESSLKKQMRKKLRKQEFSIERLPSTLKQNQHLRLEVRLQSKKSAHPGTGKVSKGLTLYNSEA